MKRVSLGERSSRTRGPITPIRRCCGELGRPACQTVPACAYGSRIGARGACHRAALCADPLARLSGTTARCFSEICDCPALQSGGRIDIRNVAAWEIRVRVFARAVMTALGLSGPTCMHRKAHQWTRTGVLGRRYPARAAWAARRSRQGVTDQMTPQREQKAPEDVDQGPRKDRTQGRARSRATA